MNEQLEKIVQQIGGAWKHDEAGNLITLLSSLKTPCALSITESGQLFTTNYDDGVQQPISLIEAKKLAKLNYNMSKFIQDEQE